MGRKSKNLRKAQFNSLPNCLNEDRSWKGRWKDWFGNDHPIFLELGCGKADMSVGLAQMHPDRNFIGTDVKAVRMWVGGSFALENEIKNVAFFRCHIEQITDFFGPGELSGLWITFPDPFPRKRQIKHRMMGLAFLKRYYEIIKPGALIQFKTDNEDLFAWALEHFQEVNQSGEMKINIVELTHDLHHSEFLNEETGILTEYERKFMAEGKPIHYVKFNLSIPANS